MPTEDREPPEDEITPEQLSAALDRLSRRQRMRMWWLIPLAILVALGTLAELLNLILGPP